MLSTPVRAGLLRFWNCEWEPVAFESWLNTRPELEAEIAKEDYLELISADYRGRDVDEARAHCERLLEAHHRGLAPRFRVSRILESILAQETPLLVGLRRIVLLRHEGYEFIPIGFVAYDSETDDIPDPSRYYLWNREALAELLAKNAGYLDKIRDYVRSYLEELRKECPEDL